MLEVWFQFQEDLPMETPELIEAKFLFDSLETEKIQQEESDLKEFNSVFRSAWRGLLTEIPALRELLGQARRITSVLKANKAFQNEVAQIGGLPFHTSS